MFSARLTSRGRLHELPLGVGLPRRSARAAPAACGARLLLHDVAYAALTSLAQLLHPKTWLWAALTVCVLVLFTEPPDDAPQPNAEGRATARWGALWVHRSPLAAPMPPSHVNIKPPSVDPLNMLLEDLDAHHRPPRRAAAAARVRARRSSGGSGSSVGSSIHQEAETAGVAPHPEGGPRAPVAAAAVDLEPDAPPPLPPPPPLPQTPPPWSKEQQELARWCIRQFARSSRAAAAGRPKPAKETFMCELAGMDEGVLERRAMQRAQNAAAAYGTAVQSEEEEAEEERHEAVMGRLVSFIETNAARAHDTLPESVLERYDAALQRSNNVTALVEELWGANPANLSKPVFLARVEQQRIHALDELRALEEDLGAWDGAHPPQNGTVATRLGMAGRGRRRERRKGGGVLPPPAPGTRWALMKTDILQQMQRLREERENDRIVSANERLQDEKNLMEMLQRKEMEGNLQDQIHILANEYRQEGVKTSIKAQVIQQAFMDKGEGKGLEGEMGEHEADERNKYG